MSSLDSREKRKRPFTLSMLSLLLFGRFLFFILLLLLSFLALSFDSASLVDNLQFFGTAGYNALLLLYFVLAILSLTTSIGIWLLRPRAWKLTVIVTGAWMLLDIWYYVSGDHAHSVSMLTNVFIVFYLVQRDVRQLFETPQSQASAA